MPIYIPDDVYATMVKSLCDEIRLCFLEPPKFCCGAASKPPIFVGVGISGENLLSRIEKNFQDLKGEIEFHSVVIGDKGKKIEDISFDVKDRAVLIFDSIVSSGETLFNMSDFFLKKGAADVKTITVFLRHDAKFIPNFWVTSIDKHDEVIFGIDQYPINSYDKGTIRKLSKNHCGNKFICGKEFINQNINDYYIRLHVDKTYTCYVLEERNEIIGIMLFKFLNTHSIYLETFATSKAKRNMGYGGNLLLFLDDYCKMRKVDLIKCHAHEDAVGFYERYNYVKTANNAVDVPGYGKFIEMKLTL